MEAGDAFESMSSAKVWEKHVDDATQTPYYYNPTTGESSWEVPEGFVEDDPVVRDATTVASDEEKGGTASSEPSKPPRWRRYVDKSSGKPYYFDEVNDVTQWDEPDGEIEDASDSESEEGDEDKGHNKSAGEAQHEVDEPGDGDEESSDKNGRGGTAVTTATHNWVKHIDKATGKPYYHDTISNVTQWETPEHYTEASQPAVVSAEYLEYLNRSRAEKLVRATQQVLDPEGNLSRLNALLNRIDDAGGPTEESGVSEETVQSLKERARAEWQQHVDPHTKRFYYHNVVTGETQWQKPDAPIVSALADWIPPESPDTATQKVFEPTVSGEHYAATAKFNRVSGRFEKLGGEEYFQALGIAADREGRQMSHFFDIQQLEKNREEAKRIKEELKRRNIDWKKVAAEKKAKKQKRQNEWIYQD